MLHASLPLRPGSAPRASLRTAASLHRRRWLVIRARREGVGAHLYPLNRLEPVMPSKVSIKLAPVGLPLLLAGRNAGCADDLRPGRVGELWRFVCYIGVPPVERVLVRLTAVNPLRVTPNRRVFAPNLPPWRQLPHRPRRRQTPAWCASTSGRLLRTATAASTDDDGSHETVGWERGAADLRYLHREHRASHARVRKETSQPRPASNSWIGSTPPRSDRTRCGPGLRPPPSL